MITHRTYLRCIFTNYNVTTVSTLPDSISVTREYNFSLNII